jgi:hypothetical protein
MVDVSYIVRIYRRDPKNPRIVAGTVEEVGIEGKKGFGSFDELRGILSAAPRGRGRRDPASARPESRRK